MKKQIRNIINQNISSTGNFEEVLDRVSFEDMVVRPKPIFSKRSAILIGLAATIVVSAAVVVPSVLIPIMYKKETISYTYCTYVEMEEKLTELQIKNSHQSLMTFDIEYSNYHNRYKVAELRTGSKQTAVFAAIESYTDTGSNFMITFQQKLNFDLTSLRWSDNENYSISEKVFSRKFGVVLTDSYHNTILELDLSHSPDDEKYNIKNYLLNKVINALSNY